MDGMITTLFNTGVDAFTNIWDIAITFPKRISSTLTSSNMSVRALGFTPPELYLNTVPVDYMGVTVQKPVPKIQGNKTFTIEFRLDANYNVYKYLGEWKRLWADPSGEGIVSNSAYADKSANTVASDSTFTAAATATSATAAKPATGGHYGSISVYPYNYFEIADASSSPSNSPPPSNLSISREYPASGSWDFKYVICTKVGTPKYNRSDSQFTTITAEFLYLTLAEKTTTIDGLLTSIPLLTT